MPTAEALNVVQAAREVGAGWSLLTDSETVCYATGFDQTIEVGHSPFAGGPPTALVSPSGDTSLLVTNLDESAASGAADEVHSYLGYCHERQQPLADNYQNGLRTLLRRHHVDGLVAVEFRSLPATASSALSACATGLAEISPALDRKRAVKTPAEITKLRRASELSDRGQAVARANTRPGRSELDVFAEMRSAWEQIAGRRVPVTGDFISGAERTAAVGGWPTTRIIREGDLVIADLAPRRDGYWTDSCNTFAVGEPSIGARRMHAVVRSALEAGMETLRPGVRACDVDATMRAAVASSGYQYPHHSGHGIGTSVHEYPRLVPEEVALIEPGMVLLLEPGAYDPKVGGIRLEWMFLVHDQGFERISQFEHDLEQ